MGLTAEEIAGLLGPYVGGAGGGIAGESAGVGAVDWIRVYGQLVVYLELILKWNARMNLTAIREPEEIVRRHFGESLFAGRFVCAGTLLDFGSGAGFPGVPIQVMWPDVQVTLAESQGKKAAFLREVVRALGLGAEVWGRRVEEMPVERRFDGVAMRAVDGMEAAVREGAARAAERVLILGTKRAEYAALGDEFREVEMVGVPASRDGVLVIARR